MQRSHGFFAGQAPIRFIGECETAVIVQLRHNGIDLRVDFPDLIEMSRHDLAGGEFSFAYETREFARARETGADDPQLCLMFPCLRRYAPVPRLLSLQMPPKLASIDSHHACLSPSMRPQLSEHWRRLISRSQG